MEVKYKGQRLSRIELEKLRSERIKEKVDLQKVKELVESIPFEIKDWKTELPTLLGVEDALTSEDERLIEILYPYLKALVVVNFLQTRTWEYNESNSFDDFHLRYAVPNDVVFAAYNVRLFKMLVQEVLELNEVYDVVKMLLLKETDNGKDIWRYYSSAIEQNPHFLELRQVIMSFYRDNADIYER